LGAEAAERPLQRTEGDSRQTVTSPLRLNRHGVIVPFRVFLGDRVARFLGQLLPVRTWRSLNARPFRSSSPRPRPGERLPGQSSHGVRPSFTVFPNSPLLAFQLRSPSLGVLLPFSASGEESPRRHQLPDDAPVARISRQVPICRLRCRSQAFPTSQRLVPLFAVPPSLRGAFAPGVQPFRGLFLSRRPGDSSSPACPLDVPPAGCATPVLGRGTCRRIHRHLGVSGRYPSPSSGPQTARESIRIVKPRLVSRRPIYPSWAFASPWFAPAHAGQGSRPGGRHALLAGGLSPDPRPTTFHGLPHTQADSLSRGNLPISRFLAFDCLFRSGDHPALAYLAPAY